MQHPTLWMDAFLAERVKGSDLDNGDNNDEATKAMRKTKMTTATMTTSFLTQQPTLWLDAFLERGGVDFDEDDYNDDYNNDHKDQCGWMATFQFFFTAKLMQSSFAAYA